ncbi:MAG TPA: hypothetical protein VN496_15215 [Burkholderiales bacterium]|nr:hypothetical protein [Burkholderiales bacterium]
MTPFADEVLRKSSTWKPNFGSLTPMFEPNIGIPTLSFVYSNCVELAFTREMIEPFGTLISPPAM